ncbi:MAG: multidrug effflux MFS transporter [Desulfuromonas sp.]|nr:multidrug effflux MFS transporter [Desulfuromonas sp.]
MIKSRIFFLLALLSAFPPLATDMYLPAIPQLQRMWQQPLSIINLTLIVFFVSYCFSLLIYGPLSDRFGRRRPLLAGITIFIAASIMCALSTSVAMLIVARVLQAAGAAGAAALAMAITKDVYTSSERARILAWMGVTMALAPAVSPILGGWIMVWLSWRWIFVVQALIAVIAGIGVLRMQETLQQPSKLSALDSAKIYFILVRNKRYIGYALMVSLVVLPHFSYIAGSADIYITRMGLSEQQFGLIFGLNALAFMSGSFLCTRLLHKISATKVMTLGFFGVLAGGVVMLSAVLSGPAGVAIPMAIITFSVGLSRPPSNNLVLDQVDEYAGSASSLLVFIFFLLGSFSMWLISLDWADKVFVVGLLATIVGSLMLLFWFCFGAQHKHSAD